MSYVQMAFDEIDFGGGAKAELTFDNILALWEEQAELVRSFKNMEQGLFTDNTVKVILDKVFDPKTKISWFAHCMSTAGYLVGYDVFKDHVFQRIQKAYREGRVRYEGQPRNTKKKGGEK